MRSATYVVNNKMGIHARPAADIAKLVGTHKSEVTLEVGSKKANGIPVKSAVKGEKNRQPEGKDNSRWKIP